jgi:hypothetical protein
MMKSTFETIYYFRKEKLRGKITLVIMDLMPSQYLKKIILILFFRKHARNEWFGNTFRYERKNLRFL